MKDSTALAPVERPSQGLVRAQGDIVEALKEYRKMQSGLDEAMPDAIMSIRDKKFRKKPYWRAVARGFNLDVVQVKEEHVEQANDWGYLVTYRATAPNGASADGDGACFASEKSRGRMEATVHNVRSHAHTRAFNRAVSNLVGFGEVSAEEAEHDSQPEPGSNDGPPPEEETAALAWRGVIATVGQKSGHSKRGPWTLYTIEGKDGSKFGTFDKKHAEFALEAGTSEVRIDWEKTDKGNKNIVFIGPAE